MPSGIELNKQAFLWVGGGLALVIYLFYSIVPSIGPHYHNHSHKSWKTRSHVQLPQEIIDLRGKAKVEEREIEVAVGGSVRCDH